MFQNIRSGILSALSASILAVPAVAADLEEGKAIFESSCAVCHGVSGRPDPDSPVVQGLGTFPADLSDPLFNSREPAGDWEMVIKYGGHAMGIGEHMPAHKSVLTDEQIASVTAYGKSLVNTSGYPPGEMNLFLSTRTRKAFPEDEIVYRGRYTNEAGDNPLKSVLEIEKRIGRRGQGILELVHVNDTARSELTEIEVGYKHALSWSADHILSGAVIYAAPVDSGDGDGELQTYLAHGTELSPSWILQSSLRLKIPVDNASDGEAELAAVIHYVHSPWPRSVFPGLEIIAENPFDSRNGDPEWTAMPQVRIGLTRGGHVAMNLAVELPLSGQSWDHRAYLTLLWDFADGGFFKGW